MTTVTREHLAGLELAMQRLNRHLAPENQKALNGLIAQASAAPEQEAVARSFIYVTMVGNGLQCYGSQARCLEWAEAWNSSISPNCQKAEVIPLYTHPSAEIERLRAELTTERLRADAAVGDANEAEQKLADSQALLRESSRAMKTAHESLFLQCMSNPIKNAWGKTVDVTEINNLQSHASKVDAFLSAQPAEVKS